MDYKTLTDGDLEQARLDVLAEQDRRRDLEAIPTEIERLNTRYNKAKGASTDWPELPQAIDAYKRRNP